jgi:hypothetical protein
MPKEAKLLNMGYNKQFRTIGPGIVLPNLVLAGIFLPAIAF